MKSRCQFLIFRHFRMFECWTGLIMTQDTSGALKKKTVSRNIAATTHPRGDYGILRTVWLSTVSAAFFRFRDHSMTRPLLALFLLSICPIARAATHRVHAGQGSSMIQRLISAASPGDTVSFDAGIYRITSGLTLKCGVTYTGPVATPATAILSASFDPGSADIFYLPPGCTSPTAIEYLGFQNTGGIYVVTTNSNLTITQNQFSNLPCCQSQGSSPAVYFDGGGSPDDPKAQILSNATLTWNTFGDPSSCLSPQREPMLSYTQDTAGNCAGVIVQSSTDGMTISNNKFVHLGEGVHFLCVNNPDPKKFPCEPPNAVTTQNVTAQYNDFSGIHRIAWEEQPQPTKNIVFEYNSYHDPTNPFFGNFDLSFACCDRGATVPGAVVTDNVLIQNVPTGPPPSYIGYGIEAWGNGAKYSHNLVEGLNNADMISWGTGRLPWEIKDNYVCSPTSKNMIHEEGDWKQTPPIQSGNVISTTCAARASSAPTILPKPNGTYSAPIQVTLIDAGFTSGVGPLGNTSIYYTTDGSSPTTSSPLYTGPFSVAPGSTVKAIGMWGSGANPKSYPANYGFVPSVVQSAHYAASNPANRR